MASLRNLDDSDDTAPEEMKMRWLTSDRVRCLDCGKTGWVQSRWLCSGHAPHCPHCRSIAVQRHDTRWSWLRDLVVITNGG